MNGLAKGNDSLASDQNTESLRQNLSRKRYSIFVINLDRSSARWEKMRGQLDRLGLSYERFPAVDGNSQPDEFLNRYYSAELNRKRYYVPLSKSEIGCYISHLKVCEKIVSENLDYAIVLEDDLILDGAFKLLPHALESIKNWNYIKLIAPFKKKKIISGEPVVFETPLTCNIENWTFNEKSNSHEATKYSKNVRTIAALKLVRWNKPPAGTQAYAITRDGASEFLAKRSKFFRPIDVDLQHTWETQLDIKGLLPALCECSEDPSEICRSKRYHYWFAHTIFNIKYALLALFK